MKRIPALLVAVSLSVVLSLSLVGCGRPEVEEIYDRVVELVEASHEVNTVFYGPGLPVYSIDSELAAAKGLYADDSHGGNYEMVTEYAKFLSVDSVLEAAGKIYSSEYLSDELSTYAFTGYAQGDSVGGSIYSYARYLEDDEWFYQSVADKPFYTAMRIYDYSTMVVEPNSNYDACYVSMDSWLEDDPSAVTVITLRLVFENGDWYLDQFTGG